MSFVLINHAPDGTHTSMHETAAAALDALAAMLGRTTAAAQQLALLQKYRW